MKYILLASALTFSTFTYAQKAKVNEAKNIAKAALLMPVEDKKVEQLTKAINIIDEAVLNEKTANDPNAWFTKAQIYFEALNFKALTNDKRIKDASIALSQAIKLSEKIKNDAEYINVAVMGAFYNYQNGIDQYNTSNYQDAAASFKHVITFADSKPNPKLTEVYSAIDTVRAQSQYFLGKSLINLEQYDAAITELNAVQNNAIIDQEKLIEDLIYASDKKGDKSKLLEYINLGRKKYPANVNISNYEINYYIDNKQFDIMIGKLEDAMKAEPNNPTHAFNLGVLYSNLAAPVEGVLPSNHLELEKKAEQAFMKALESAGDNPGYNQSLGILYYNAAADAIAKSKIFLQGDAKDKSKAAQMLAIRDNYFNKAFPVLEKTAKLYEALPNMTAEDKYLYAATLEALKKIYATKNNSEMFNKTKNKLDNLK
jgi:hypothetical protein